MKKTEENKRYFLKKELFSLRKGTGVTLWKLDKSHMLRRIVAERTNTELTRLSADQVHSYLLFELQRLGASLEAQATRNAFAIGHENGPGTLLERRTRFAAQVGRHPDTIEAYETHGINEIISRLQHPALFKQADSAVPVAAATVPAEHPDMTPAVRRIAAHGVSELYGLAGDAHASTILDALGREPFPYLDTTIEWQLLPSEKGSDYYKIKMRYTFRRQKGYYRVGIVTSPHDAEALMNSGVVDEVAQLDKQAYFERELETIIANTSFIVSDPETKTRMPLRFKEINTIQRRELLAPVWQMTEEDCRIIEVRIPDELQKSSTIYEYRLAIDLKNVEYYAYWYAPGLVYLNTISIDISRFPDREKWIFNILPFFGQVFPGTLERTGDRFTMPAGSWVVQGHGFALAWQKK